MPIKISRSRINLDDGRLEQATVRDYGETVNALGSVSGTTDIDLELGNVVTATISGNTAFTFSNPPASGAAGGFTLILANGGSADVVWPGAVQWASGSAPTLTQIGSDVLAFFTPDQGTTWHGVLSGANMVASPPSTYGYRAGGQNSPLLSTTDRITYSTATNAAYTTSDLPSVHGYQASISDTSTYGYISGGITSGVSPTNVSKRITFSTEAFAADANSNLSQARYYPIGLSDTSTYGYTLGGYTGGYVATADRLTFSTGVAAASTDSNLSTNRGYLSSVSDATTYGYIGGAYDGAAIASTDRITFSTSVTAANTDSNLSSARANATGVSAPTTYGYFCGGSTNLSVASAVTDRIVFSTSVTSAHTISNLTTARFYVQESAGDGSLYGYVIGGYTGADTAAAERMTYSTEVFAAATSANASVAKRHAGSISDGSL